MSGWLQTLLGGTILSCLFYWSSSSARQEGYNQALKDQKEKETQDEIRKLRLEIQELKLKS